MKIIFQEAGEEGESRDFKKEGERVGREWGGGNKERGRGGEMREGQEEGTERGEIY